MCLFQVSVLQFNKCLFLLTEYCLAVYVHQHGTHCGMYIYRVDVRMDGCVNGWTVDGEINGNTDMIV